MARKALGKGISALLGAAKPELDTSLRELDVALLEPNPFQTREIFDKERLRELARSLEVNGFVQPIAVRPVQELVKGGKLSMGHARALLALDDSQAQQALAAEASRRGWSVRRIERLISQQKKSTGKTEEPKGPDPNVKAAAAKLETSLGTRVRIVPKGNRGRIEIEYYSQEELQRLYQRLLKN